MKLLVLDNYDSFTYNLVQLLRNNSGAQIDVYRNDEITLEAVAAYDKILLSPGPGIPADASILCALIERYGSHKSIFGVCLGMQAIGEVYGARLYNMEEPLHGISTPVSHNGSQIFDNVPASFRAGRYHSWAVDAATLPAELAITATDASGTVMALEHRQHKVGGVQFHPESILTEHGETMIRNFLLS